MGKSLLSCFLTHGVQPVVKCHNIRQYSTDLVEYTDFSACDRDVVALELNSTTRTRTRTRHGPDTDIVRARCRVRAKFHYTDPTGPDRTRTDFFAAKLRWVRAGLRQSPCGSVRVRAGQVGSGRTRVVEFSYYWANKMTMTMMTSARSRAV